MVSNDNGGYYMRSWNVWNIEEQLMVITYRYVMENIISTNKVLLESWINTLRSWNCLKNMLTNLMVLKWMKYHNFLSCSWMVTCFLYKFWHYKFKFLSNVVLTMTIKLIVRSSNLQKVLK